MTEWRRSLGFSDRLDNIVKMHVRFLSSDQAQVAPLREVELLFLDLSCSSRCGLFWHIRLRTRGSMAN